MTMGEMITAACGLIRNIILARVLTKADFGIAAMLGMTVSLMEIGGRLSIGALVVQSKDVDQPGFLATAQFVQAMLGIVSGFVIYFAAYPTSRIFNVPEAAWALQFLALVPLLRSLSHLDVQRMVRELRFTALVFVEVVPQLLFTLAVWPLARMWQSYEMLVWLLIGQQAAATISSHIAAERPYQWRCDPKTVASILSFGWPMVISSFLMFFITQGDRFTIGISYSASELGVYAVAGTLTLAPANLLLKVCGSVLLPFLASAQAQAKRFQHRLASVSQILCLASTLYAVPMIVAGEALVKLVFGSKYTDAGALAAWLALAQALRLVRGVPTVAAMAKGDTKNLMFSNVFRLSGLVLAFPMAFAGASLATIAACAAIGEIVALIGSYWRFSRQSCVPVGSYVPEWLLGSGFIVLSAGIAWLGVPRLSLWIPLASAALLCLALVILHFVIFGESIRLLLSKRVGSTETQFAK